MSVIDSEFIHTIISIERIQKIAYNNIHASPSWKHEIRNERVQSPYMPIVDKPQNDKLTGWE